MVVPIKYVSYTFAASVTFPFFAARFFFAFIIEIHIISNCQSEELLYLPHIVGHAPYCVTYPTTYPPSQLGGVVCFDKQNTKNRFSLITNAGRKPGIQNREAWGGEIFIRWGNWFWTNKSRWEGGVGFFPFSSLSFLVSELYSVLPLYCAGKVFDGGRMKRQSKRR